MNYVADTHSLVWYFTEDSRLSKKAVEAFEQALNKGTVIIPAVVLAEIIFIAKKGKITLTFEETLKKIEQYENYYVAPLDIEILRITDNIQVDLEMHDKLIVATAICFETKLITKDEQITNAKIISTIW